MLDVFRATVIFAFQMGRYVSGALERVEAACHIPIYELTASAVPHMSMLLHHDCLTSRAAEREKGVFAALVVFGFAAYLVDDNGRRCTAAYGTDLQVLIVNVRVNERRLLINQPRGFGAAWASLACGVTYLLLNLFAVYEESRKTVTLDR